MPPTAVLVDEPADPVLVPVLPVPPVVVPVVVPLEPVVVDVPAELPTIRAPREVLEDLVLV